MPTYDYRCPEGHTFELFQKMSDDPVATCPTCGAEAERVISGGAGFLFKGDGFYITDYRSDAYKKKAEAEQGGSKADGDGKKAAASKDDGGSTPSSSSPESGGGAASGSGASSGTSGSSGGSSGGGSGDA